MIGCLQHASFCVVVFPAEVAFLYSKFYSMSLLSVHKRQPQLSFHDAKRKHVQCLALYIMEACVVDEMRQSLAMM